MNTNTRYFFRNVLKGFASVTPITKRYAALDHDTRFETLRAEAWIRQLPFDSAFIVKAHSEVRTGQLLYILLMVAAIAVAVAYAETDGFLARAVPISVLVFVNALAWFARKMIKPTPTDAGLKSDLEVSSSRTPVN